MDVAAIRVKIGLRPNGHADHPNWKLLPSAASGKPEDQMFFGWKYDKQCGHKDETLGSPFGQQFGMMLCTPQLADEAIATFPAATTRLTEAQCEAFCDNKTHAHQC